MKRWAIITVLLYGLLLAGLTVPVCWLGSFKKFRPTTDGTGVRLEAGWRADTTVDNIREIYRAPGYWIGLGIMLTCQAALFFVPVKMPERRWKSRRHLLVPTITTAFLIANLCFAGVLALACGIFGDKAGEPIEWMVETASTLGGKIPGVAQILNGLGTNRQTVLFSVHVLGIIVLLWIVWGTVFYRFARRTDPAGLTQYCVRWLLRGSILELLVAVPSHVIVRQRPDCCAPIGSFWGIATGLAVMLLAFGPGVFFLFVERIQRRQPRMGPPTAPGEVPPEIL